MREGADLTVVCYGTMVNEALDAADSLSALGVSTEIVKLGIVFPNDYTGVLSSLRKTGRLLMAEEVCAAGCVGERILSVCAEKGLSLQGAKLLNLGDGVIPHGTVAELRRDYGIDARAITRTALALCGRETVDE